MTTNDNLGIVETGNRPWVKAVVTAPNVPGHTTDTSTAITFVMHKPDATETAPISSPNADIAGPVAGTTVVDGVTLTTTTWYWKVPLLTLPGDHTIRWTSTAGIVAQDNSTLSVPIFTPFATA